MTKDKIYWLGKHKLSTGDNVVMDNVAPGGSRSVSAKVGTDNFEELMKPLIEAGVLKVETPKTEEKHTLKSYGSFPLANLSEKKLCALNKAIDFYAESLPKPGVPPVMIKDTIAALWEVSPHVCFYLLLMILAIWMDRRHEGNIKNEEFVYVVGSDLKVLLIPLRKLREIKEMKLYDPMFREEWEAHKALSILSPMIKSFYGDTKEKSCQ